MKKIKAIDLLNKIANGEEVPAILDKNDNKYIFNKATKRFELENSSWCYFGIEIKELNEEVEIIEEDKPIEQIIIDEDNYIQTADGVWEGRKMDIAFAKIINEIIDVLNEIKENKEEK